MEEAKQPEAGTSKSLKKFAFENPTIIFESEPPTEVKCDENKISMFSEEMQDEVKIADKDAKMMENVVKPKEKVELAAEATAEVYSGSADDAKNLSTEKTRDVKDKTEYVWENILINEYCRLKNNYTLECGKRYGLNGLLGINNTDKIMKDAIIKKVIFFYTFDIGILKKGSILPGRELKHIEELYLSQSNISEIENGTFDDFPNLKDLDLYGNKLTLLHDGILTEKVGITLRNLSFGGNPLKILNASTFKNLKNLENLKMESIPNIAPFIKSGIFPESLKNLKDLTIYNNNISSFDDNIFANLTNLEDLSLYINPLSSIPKAINMLPNLKSLGFGSIKNISSIFKRDPNVMSPSLKSIYLDGTNIISVDDCAFCNFPNLTEVTFHDCTKLERIHENAFGAITQISPLKIESFGIQNTNISTLSENLLDWENVKKLYLDLNQWNCDCSLSWLINDLSDKNSSKHNHKLKAYFWHRRELTCNNPPELRGKKLIEISDAISICDEGKNKTFKVLWVIGTFVGIIGSISTILWYFYRESYYYYPKIKYQKGISSEDLVEMNE